jgi:hypothetical protein
MVSSGPVPQKNMVSSGPVPQKNIVSSGPVPQKNVVSSGHGLINKTDIKSYISVPDEKNDRQFCCVSLFEVHPPS